MIDRNYQELVGLQTGITPPAPALGMVRDPAHNRLFSADGQAPDTNVWLQDALLNQEPFRGTAIRVTPEDVVQQVDIETNNLTADKGYVGGAVVTSSTATGTNGLHGSLFEVNSGDWSRTKYFLNSVGPNPRFVYNQFGATVGAPISRDQTFFFASYEGTYQSGGNTPLTTVPTPATLTGNFSGIPGLTLYNPRTGAPTGTGRAAYPGNVIPISSANPTALAIAGGFPAPNLPGLYDNYLPSAACRSFNPAPGSRKRSALRTWSHSTSLKRQHTALRDLGGCQRMAHAQGTEIARTRRPLRLARPLEADEHQGRPVAPILLRQPPVQRDAGGLQELVDLLLHRRHRRWSRPPFEIHEDADTDRLCGER